MDQSRRKIFNASLVIDRKAQITSVAIDHEGSRVFLGLEDGMLEEYSLEVTGIGAMASLTARKPIIAKRPILCILPATPATCLAVLAGDAALRFVHSDTLESKVMHKGPVLAAAVSLLSDKRLPRIAIATRTGIGRAVKAAAFEILPAGGKVAGWRPLWEIDLPPAPGAMCLAWAGDSLVVGLGQRYLLAMRSGSSGKCTWRELFSVEEGGAVAAVSLPRQGCVFLSAGPVGVVVNPAGEPVGNPPHLQDLPAVRALASGAGTAAVVCEDGMHILDPASGTEVQLLGYGDGATPIPGQPLRAAGGGAPQSETVVVSGRHKVWALTPVPPADQARELLQRREYTGAAVLASAGAARGEPWAEEAFAQAALLLMHDGRFSEAMDALDKSPPAVFQPSELFPLFPEHNGGRPAASQENTAQQPQHWGLHPPLEAVDAMIARAPVLRDDVRSLDAAVRGAKQAVVHYLFRARGLPNIAAPEGVDTLLMHLLLDLEAAEEAAAFAASPNAVACVQVADRLLSAGWLHSLATLHAAEGDAEPALRIWQSVASADEAAASPRSAQERKEALEGAAALMKSETSCPADLALSFFPWLLSSAPKEADKVLVSRADLPHAQVLPLLPVGHSTRWRYLSHITARGCQEESVHTELAASLVAAVFQAAPHLAQQQHALQEQLHRPAPLPASLPAAAAQVSVAALVSGGRRPDPDSAADEAEALRLRLRLHLESSSLWDPSQVMAGLQGSALLEETVMVHWRRGDHEAALRVLALTLRDLGAAVGYAAACLPAAEHSLVLRLVLSPGGSDEPRWEDACRVVAALGASLDPLEVVEAAPGSMPLVAAMAMVGPLIRERGHRRRAGQITAALHRGQVTSRAARQAAAEGQKVVVDDGRACPKCHLRIGGKVFVVVPGEGGEGEPQSVLCLSCWKRPQ